MAVSGIPLTIFWRMQHDVPISHRERDQLLALFLAKNNTLRNFVREGVDSMQETVRVSGDEPDQAVNLAIFNADGFIRNEHQIQALSKTHRVEKLSQYLMLDDQPVCPLIFWNGAGGAGVEERESIQGSTTRMQNVLIVLILQPCHHFIGELTNLREEYICAVQNRLISLNIKFLTGVQKRYFTREDEIRDANPEGNSKQYGLRTFIPPSFTDSDEYWHSVATKCSTILTQFGAPTFFLTMTMNPDWPDYQGFKRSPGTLDDSAIITIVFKQRVFALMKFVQQRKVFGNMSAFVWRIKHQKGGLPHAHILFWTDFDTQDMDA
jgi:hypothetical protein